MNNAKYCILNTTHSKGQRNIIKKRPIIQNFSEGYKIALTRPASCRTYVSQKTFFKFELHVTPPTT